VWNAELDKEAWLAKHAVLIKAAARKESLGDRMITFHLFVDHVVIIQQKSGKVNN
jgi:hypothetical protein